MNKLKWIALAVILIPLSAYVVFYTTVMVLAFWTESWHAASRESAASADVIVRTSGPPNSADSIQLVPFRDAETFVKDHPGATFLIARGWEDSVVARLMRTPEGLPSASIKTKWVADTIEQITLEYMSRADDTEGSRYIATPNHVALQQVRHVGDRDGMGIVIAAIVVTPLVQLFGAIGAIVWAVRRRRKARARGVGPGV